MGRPRVLWLSNYPVPYQQEFLAALVAAGELELTACFLEDRDPGRPWPGASSQRVRVLPSIGRRLPPELRLHPTLPREIWANRPDVALLGGYSYLSLQVALLELRALGVPTLFWMEEPRLDRGGAVQRGVRQALLRPLRSARGVLAVGERAAAVWRAALPGVEAVSFPYACALDRYLEIPRPRHRPAGDGFTFLYSGQLIHRKGVDLLLAAFAQAAVQDPGLRLVLAGDGPDRASLEASVAPALRPRVEFRGFLPWERLPEVYAEADALVIPSRHDGWALVVNEAFAAGLPVIASDRVGASELVVAGETGIVVPAGEVAPLARALGSLPPDAARMGLAARGVARDRLHPDKAAARMAELVRRVLDRRPLGGA